MSVETKDVLTAIAAIIAAVGGPRFLVDAWRQLNRTERMRRSVESDLILFEKVNWNSADAKSLRDSIDSRLGQIAKGDGKSRDPFGITLGIMFVLIGAGVAWAARSVDGLLDWVLWPLAGAMLILGVSGLLIDGKRAHRDEKGNPR